MGSSNLHELHWVLDDAYFLKHPLYLSPTIPIIDLSLLVSIRGVRRTEYTTVLRKPKAEFVFFEAWR